jgi:translocator protein
MWIAIVVMLIAFYQVRPLAAYLNIPYLLWVSFATALNAAYFKLN